MCSIGGPGRHTQRSMGIQSKRQLGHPRTKHNGKYGVAIFHAPAGVVRFIPETVTCAGQVTTLAATAAGREYFRGEMGASWREACKGFAHQASQFDVAR